MIDYADMAGLVNQEAVACFRARGANPETPELRGTAQNPDMYFQGREACNPYYARLPAIVADHMAKVSALTGRSYGPFRLCRGPGSRTGGGVDGQLLRDHRGGGFHLTGAASGWVWSRCVCIRPFATGVPVRGLPATAEKLTVLDRTKEPGALGDPLYTDICTALVERAVMAEVVAGRYGLGSKEFNPAMVKAVYDNMAAGAQEPVHRRHQRRREPQLSGRRAGL
jgi:pyruvate-ferredoxin/flavodoxin oxidoreductase